MPIKSRFVQGGNASAQYLLPQPIFELFDRTPRIGTVSHRAHFFKRELIRADERRKPLDDLWFWVRPAFTNYHHNERTHVIIIGHILLCSPDDETPSETARSVRLFVDDPGHQSEMFKLLLRRVRRR